VGVKLRNFLLAAMISHRVEDDNEEAEWALRVRQDQPIHIPRHLTLEHLHVIGQMCAPHGYRALEQGDIGYIEQVHETIHGTGNGVPWEHTYYEFPVSYQYRVRVQNAVLFQDGGAKYGSVAVDYAMPCGVPGYEIDFQSPDDLSRTHKLIVIPFSPDEWPFFLIWNGNGRGTYQPGCLQRTPHLRVVDLDLFCQRLIVRSPRLAPRRQVVTQTEVDYRTHRLNCGWFYACVHVMLTYLDPTRRNRMIAIDQLLRRQQIPFDLHPLFYREL
jgi:hypothetical protein